MESRRGKPWILKKLHEHMVDVVNVCLILLVFLWWPWWKLWDEFKSFAGADRRPL